MGRWYVRNIFIDSREKTRGYNAYMHYTDKDYKLNVTELEYGDYIFHTNDNKYVVFEFKTCDDFINSMEDKSLFHEISNQHMHYTHSYLIVCGDFEKSYENLYWKVPQYRYKYKLMRNVKTQVGKQVRGALNRIYAMYTPVIFADTEEDAFDRMLEISIKVADEKRYGGVVRPIPKRLGINPVTHYLGGIRGIGEKIAENITDEFELECLDDLCNVRLSDLKSVNGVTKKNIGNIWKGIHNENVEE